MRITPSFTLLVTLVGCGNSFVRSDTDAGSPALDAAGPDLGPDLGADLFDAGDLGPLDCMPHEFRGCSHARYEWYWNGDDCELIFDCWGMGETSRRACLAARVGCGAADPCSAMDAEDIPVACPPTPGYGWDGDECTRIECCEGPHCDGLFASEDECAAEYVECGAPNSCGPELALGSNTLPADRLAAAPRAAECVVTAGEDWLARGVFIAPEPGYYAFRAHPLIAFGGPTDIAIFNGRCSDERRSCFSGEGGGDAVALLRANDVITVLAKPEYHPVDGDPVALFSRIEISISFEPLE